MSDEEIKPEDLDEAHDPIGFVHEVTYEQVLGELGLTAENPMAREETDDELRRSEDLANDAADEMYAEALGRLKQDERRPYSREQFYLAGGSALAYAMLAVADEIRALRISLTGDQQ